MYASVTDMISPIASLKRASSATAIALLLGLAGVFLVPPIAAHAAVTDVTIYDDANVLDDEKVAKEISALSSDEDAHIAVIASDDPSLTEDGYDEDVKSLIANGDYADIQGEGDETLNPDVVLISISPDLRKLGTYAGDDISRADQIADKAVGEMKSPARDGDWDQTAITGATSSLKAVNGDYEREQKMRAERFEKGLATVAPFVAGLFALLALGWLASKIVPLIFKTISDYRREKRLLAWSPSKTEVERSVRYWRDIDQRVAEASEKSPASRSALSGVIDTDVIHAVEHMDQTGTVPGWAKTSSRVKSRIEEGMSDGTPVFWAKTVQPLLSRVKAGSKDEDLRDSVSSAVQASKDALRFMKKFGSEIDLSSHVRETIKEGASTLRDAAEHAAKEADAQQITPWDAARRINGKRKDFERLSKKSFEGPVRNNMSQDRRREVSGQGHFSNQSFLTTILAYSMISSHASHSSYSSHSSHSSSSSSYSAISSSISSGGFSGGSGSF